MYVSFACSQSLAGYSCLNHVTYNVQFGLVSLYPVHIVKVDSIVITAYICIHIQVLGKIGNVTMNKDNNYKSKETRVITNTSRYSSGYLIPDMTKLMLTKISADVVDCLTFYNFCLLF